MSATTADPAKAVSRPVHRYQPILLVFGCTLLGAAAQVLMKTGANQMASPSLLEMARNLPLMAGYSLYGLSTLLLVLALRDGELSILYPIIALTYVWVTFLSLVIFHDALNPWRLLGVALIVAGVAILGRSGGR